MSVTIVSESDVEPISLEEAKTHLYVEHTADDALIHWQIKAARQYCESKTALNLVTRTFDYKFTRFPYHADQNVSQIYGAYYFEIPRDPLISVTSITYTDDSQSPTTQTLSTDIYGVDTDANPPRVYLKYGQTWPNNRDFYNDITVRFLAGYVDTTASPADTSEVPEPVKAAIKLIVGDLYHNREGQTSMQTYKNPTVDMLLDCKRFFRT